MNPYADRATGIIAAWETNCRKDLTVGDREILHLMLIEALQDAAWRAQQPGAPVVVHPRS